MKESTFKTIIENVPLVSIDLCLVNRGRILLGNRNNDPLKHQWFTPGGRIFKNEPWQISLARIAKSELDINVKIERFRSMGIWDHFYSNNAIDDNVSTHYVNLPHYAIYDEKPDVKSDNQHNKLDWFSLEEVYENDAFHKYIRIYAKWLIKLE